MAMVPRHASASRTVKARGQLSGAWLVRYALESLPVSYTFGVPGVHNTELYDELSRSETIRPVLVTHEGGASFIADAISRTSPGEIGTLAIVPAAGVTHALSGIAEARLAGVPMLVITGGIRTDVPYAYQIHEIDQQSLVAQVTKAAYKAREHRDIVPAIFEAYREAVTGVPGPVLVEVPVNVQLFRERLGEVPVFEPPQPPALPAGAEERLDAAAELLAGADNPGIFVGWGAVDVTGETEALADHLGAPVSTTLQGLSAFRGDHPLHAGMGFGPAAVPAAVNAFQDCDCLLAVGTRFAEIATGSFSCRVPDNLVHVDLDPSVIGRNFPAKVGIEGDARTVMPELRRRVPQKRTADDERRRRVAERIASDKRAYREEWYRHKGAGVNPARFFDELRGQLERDAIVAVDDGNHTYLAAELWPVLEPRSFICPTDFNCMGYCVPGAVGAKLANPRRRVVGVNGDGAFLMTGLELLTATSEHAGLAMFVFSDGELSQISQGQELPYNRKSCTVLGEAHLDGVARATGAHYVAIDRDDDLANGVREALTTADEGRPVVVDVRIDYSKRTRFTQGVVKSTLKRFPLADKVRFVSRALGRRLGG